MGSASSRSQQDINLEEDLKAVQRGDQMANKVFRFVEKCCNLDENPILSIHDSRFWWYGKCYQEISEPNGAKFF